MLNFNFSSNYGQLHDHILQDESIQMKTDAKKEKEKEKKTVKKEGTLVERLLSGDDTAKEELVNTSRSTAPPEFAQQKTHKQVQERVHYELSQMMFGKENPEDTVQITTNMVYDVVKEKELKKKEEAENTQELIDRTIEDELTNQDHNPQLYQGSQAVKQQVASDKMRKVFSKIDQKNRQEMHREFERSGKGLVKEYSDAYSKFLFTKNPDYKQKMEDVKRNLEKFGFSSKDTQNMERKVSDMVRQHVVGEIKKKVIKYYFSHATKKSSVDNLDLITFIKTAEENERLGGKDFGNYKGGLDLAVSEQMSEVKREITGFIYDELEQSYFGSHIATDVEGLMKRVTELQNLAKKLKDPGFDMNSLLNRVRNSIDDLGLNHYLPKFEKLYTVESFNELEDGQSRRRKKNQQETIEEINYLSKEDQLEEKLRALYMAKVLYPDLKEQAKIMFKIIKLKNGMVKLGCFSDERLAELEKEGQFLAKAKVVTDYRKVCEEEATLRKLEGAEFELLKNKKKHFVKCLKKARQPLKKKEMKQLQDEANRELFPILKSELNNLEAISDINNTVDVHRKIKFLKDTLTRLKEESEIDENLTYTIGDKTFSATERSIIEAA